ncbi:MarR family winged helix-turn-helix transcriptional regulator [Schaalia naturae]|uniref:MarR family winged helix-turn-helix transcriptional regulator n=1 Tax=Schaalia naturae TaxID=635203 RepID=UPI003626E715
MNDDITPDSAAPPDEARQPDPDEPVPAQEPAPAEADTDAHAVELRLHLLSRLLRRAHGGRRGPGPHDETRGQGRVLALLTLHSPIAQRDLAYLLGVRPQSMGELLAKLEGVGLVRRLPDPDDARARLVELTEAGRSAARELAARPGIDPLAPLSEDERATFLAMADRIIEGLEQAVGAEPDRDWPHRRGGFDPDAGPGPRGRHHGGPHAAHRSRGGGSAGRTPPDHPHLPARRMGPFGARGH